MTLRELISKCRYGTIQVVITEIVKSRSDKQYFDFRTLLNLDEDYVTAGDILTKFSDDVLDLEVSSFDIWGGFKGKLMVDVIRWVN